MKKRFGKASMFKWLLVVLPLLFAVSCGSSDSGDKTTQDVVADAATDTTVPTDVVEQDGTVPDNQVDPETVEDVAQDLPWEELPTLPTDKEFTTRYIAGAATVDASPDKPVFMGGFGFCMGKIDACRISEGIHDPIEVNAVAIGDTETGEVVFFVSVDAAGFFKYDVDLVHEAAPAAFQERFGVKMEGPRIIMGASHAHSAPDTCGIWAPMEKSVRDDEEYIAYVRDSVLEAALEAYGNLGDVEMVWGKGNAINHTDDAFTDNDIFTVKGIRPEGETVFTLTRWNAHPTSYGSENLALSADYVGTFRKTIKEQLGGVAVYMNGCVGSTYSEAPDGCQMDDLFPEGYQQDGVNDNKSVCVGVNLAEKTVEALDSAVPVAETGLFFRHYKVLFHPDNFALMTLGDIGPAPIPHIDLDDPEDKMETQFSWVTFGELDYVSTPGESFPSFGKKIKDILAAKGRVNGVVMGLTQDWMGYLMTTDQWEDDDPELNYYKSLSPGILIYGEYMSVFEAAVDDVL